jgi:hypothetical protein
MLFELNVAEGEIAFIEQIFPSHSSSVNQRNNLLTILPSFLDH